VGSADSGASCHRSDGGRSPIGWMGLACVARGRVASSFGGTVVGRTFSARPGMGWTPGGSGSGSASRRVSDLGRAACPVDP